MGSLCSEAQRQSPVRGLLKTAWEVSRKSTREASWETTSFRESATGETWKVATRETWEAATGKLRELHLFLDGFLDAGLPVLIEAFDVGIEEGQTVGEPFLQDSDLFVVAADAIVGEHPDGIEAAFAEAAKASREASEIATREASKHAKAALLFGGLLRGLGPLRADQ